jgi:hypothetical protein
MTREEALQTTGSKVWYQDPNGGEGYEGVLCYSQWFEDFCFVQRWMNDTERVPLRNVSPLSGHSGGMRYTYSFT